LCCDKIDQLASLLGAKMRATISFNSVLSIA
jgi:hypothetical protein